MADRVVSPSHAPWQRPRWLRWPEADRILVEQLRLVNGNAPVSYAAAGAVSLMMAWVLGPSSGTALLLAWSAAACAVMVAAMMLARKFAATGDQLGHCAAALRNTILVYASVGALWGLLPWLALDGASPYEATWMIGVFCGMLAGGMTFMAPVLPVFIAYAVLMVVPMGLKLLLHGHPSYAALSVGCAIILATTIAQAIKIAQTFRDTIRLRLTNEDLVDRLREETESAQAARAHAEAANLAKSKFLAAASHDLRQPIHAQGLFLEVLAGTALTDQQAHVLFRARSASQASSAMLDTLLDFSRIEAGVIHPQPKVFALQEVLHRIENDLAPLADAKGLVYRTRDSTALAWSDPALVEMVLRNLVSNAIRYTERGGVLLGCRRAGAALVVEVWDSGVGIAPEHQNEVFREFHQLGNPERDRAKGLGLGLAIARGLALALGSELCLASRPGRGSVFRLTLPVAVPGTQNEPASAGPDRRAPGQFGDHDRLHGLRVLVIDDDDEVREGMAQLLQSWGCQCQTADGIDAALALARQDYPEVVLSDYRLREQRTGAEAIAALRAIPRTSTELPMNASLNSSLIAHLPALLITGDTDPKRLREAQASGVPLLHKPVTAARLQLALIEVLGGSPDPSSKSSLSQGQTAAPNAN